MEIKLTESGAKTLQKQPGQVVTVSSDRAFAMMERGLCAVDATFIKMYRLKTGIATGEHETATAAPEAEKAVIKRGRKLNNDN